MRWSGEGQMPGGGGDSSLGRGLASAHMVMGMGERATTSCAGLSQGREFGPGQESREVRRLCLSPFPWDSSGTLLVWAHCLHLSFASLCLCLGEHGSPAERSEQSSKPAW